MRKFIPVSILFLFFNILGCLLSPLPLWAHGIVGQRFFPETITVEDPFPADEMDLLSYSNRRSPATGGIEQKYGFGIQKRLSRDTGLSIATSYDNLSAADPITGENLYGFENFSLTLKFAFVRDPVRELIISSGVAFEIGGTGTKRLGDTTSTLQSRIWFGKGFGDLPDSLNALKPFAITGFAGLATPLVNSVDPVDVHTMLNYGVTVMYSLPYFQSFIKDVGIPWPLSRTFPIVEFNFATDINGPTQGSTSATANPGFLWTGRYYELGVEAIIPMVSGVPPGNPPNVTGNYPGAQILLHLFLDDIFSNTVTWTPFSGFLGPTRAPK